MTCTPRFWFTSDQHYGHNKIIEYANRPFGSVGEMDEEMIRRHNEVVSQGDFVFHLGDFMFHATEVKLKNLLRKLNGNHGVILGNHDHDPLFKTIPHHYRLWERSFEGIQVTLCHYPMLSWQASFHGAFQLHGHTHGTIPFDPLVRRLDVGVDCWDFRPVEWEIIRTRLLAVPTPKQLKENGLS